MSTKIALSEITSDWLAANIKGKDLLAAVSILMGTKRRNKKSTNGDSDKPKREVSEGLAAHHQHTAAIAALVRKFKEEVEAESREFDLETLPKSAHLRVTSYLKTEGTIDTVIEEDDIDAIEGAINFLVENPDWKPPKKTANKAPAKKVESKKETVKAAKPSKSTKKPAAKFVVSDSEDEAPVVKAETKAKPAAKSTTKTSTKATTKPTTKKEVLSDSEDESSNLKAIQWEGKDYFWDQEETLYADKQGKKKVGSFDGAVATFE